jgi:tubulin monoglycylase TTLL3/8
VLGTLPEIRSLVSSKCGSNRTIIIQKYLENPFLYNKRKFDIRCYILITTVNGIIKGYWYEEGYIRTTSK